MVEGKGKKAARERAMAKAMAMTVLFKKDHYSAITDVLDRKGEINAESDFKEACAAAGLDDDEIEWLWNYLKHYDSYLAEKTDSKWPAVAEASGIHW
jgi:hypothetical protein